MKIEVHSFFYMGSLFTSEKIPVQKENRSQPESKSVLTYQEIWNQSRHSKTTKTFAVLTVFLTNGIWRYIKLEKVYLFFFLLSLKLWCQGHHSYYVRFPFFDHCLIWTTNFIYSKHNLAVCFLTIFSVSPLRAEVMSYSFVMFSI